MKRSNSEQLVKHNQENSRQTRDIYGNYKAYYTTRRLPKTQHDIDPRIDLLDDNLFKDKQVLDIGCNSGNITIGLAKQKGPEYICGIDIDKKLIQNANNNIKIVYSLSDPNQDTKESFDLTLRRHYFPLSMTFMHGFISMNTPPSAEVQGFPHNIEFKEADWTKGKVEKEKYDTILALSVTKWIQLHKGDDGLKRFFKKIYNSLKTGGTLVLEAQDFTTFQKRAKNTELNVDVEKELQFKPENYTEYLIKEVGFTSVNDLGVPKDESKGFSRPVVLYTK